MRVSAKGRWPLHTPNGNQAPAGDDQTKTALAVQENHKNTTFANTGGGTTQWKITEINRFETNTKRDFSATNATTKTCVYSTNRNTSCRAGETGAGPKPQLHNKSLRYVFTLRNYDYLARLSAFPASLDWKWFYSSGCCAPSRTTCQMVLPSSAPPPAHLTPRIRSCDEGLLPMYS